MISIGWGEPPIEKPLVGQSAATQPSLSVLRIVHEVAYKHKLSAAKLLGKSRRRHLAWPRQEAMYRAWHETDASLPAIGATMNRDHTTVLFGIRAHEKRLRGNDAT